MNMKNKKTIYFGILLPFIGIVLLLGVYLLIRFFFSSPNIPGEFKTTMVDRGPVVLTQDAKGVVTPGNEVVLLSPASSVITRIVKAAGSRVKAGEIILKLDPRIIEDNIESMEDQLEIKRNDLLKNKLNARSTTIDLDYNVEVKKLGIVSLKSELVDQEQLLDVGGISPAQFEKTKQELNLAEKELKMVLEKNSIRVQQLEAEEEGLKLQIEVQEKELEEKKEVLTKMNVKAASDGIILAVYGNEGEKVNADQLLVRMSDLTSYKINGSVDESRANIVKTGGTVYAIIGEEKLEGRIGTVRPLVENNTVRFDIFLEQSNHPKLIPNMNIELQVIVSQRDSVLRMKKDLAVGRGNKHDVFVVQNGKAMRRRITTGLVGLDFIEIISGLEEGDQVITSDLSALRRKKEIEIPE
jgi:HlyD family secretion protein